MRVTFGFGLITSICLIACSGAKPTELEGAYVETPAANEPGTDGDGDRDAPPATTPPPSGGGGGAACKQDPSKYDFPGNGVDEDCSGKADDEAACDDSLALASNDANDAAKALGVCKPGGGTAWGVVSAKWLLPDGTALPAAGNVGHGLLAKLGALAPKQGKSMVAISTGAARAPSDAGYVANDDKGYTNGVPASFTPKLPASCTAVTFGDAHDGVMLELQVRVPSNARAMTFTTAVLAADYPSYLCSEYDDFFTVTMEPKPADRADGNLLVDAQGNALTVNSSLFKKCDATACKDTGFDTNGWTGWLDTTVGVSPGSLVTLRFAIWDSGDGQYDTTAVLDGLVFSASPAPTTHTQAR